MAGMMGWPPETFRAASPAEFWAHWIGHAKAQGWLRQEGPDTSEAAVRELDELMARYPDQAT